MNSSDLLIVGAGIVGLSAAYRFTQTHPDLKVCVIEKERDVALHQTGRNSGVIHSGIYYRPGSLKAKTCLAGRRKLIDFCDQFSVPYETCGKVIVAVENLELPRLQALYERGLGNGVSCSFFSPEELKEREPHVTGMRALFVPDAGIVDYAQVCRALKEDLVRKGHTVLLETSFGSMKRHHGELVVLTNQGEIRSKVMLNCAGLYSDRIARSCDQAVEAKIIPFRGEYYKFLDGAPSLCRHLIYPVPDPDFPFLGVHFTRMIDGTVECGPNAVFAFAREGYSNRTIDIGELFESCTYPGFLRLAKKHWRMGLEELRRSFSKGLFVEALQRLIPDTRAEYLMAAPSGVRAQALSRQGALLDDFAIEESACAVHVINAPSPAATASFEIAEELVKKISLKLDRD